MAQQQLPDAYKLRPHQEPVCNHADSRELQVSSNHPNGIGGLMIAGPGSGKTVMMLHIMLKRMKHTLVVCPASLVDQNAEKFRRFCNGKLDVNVFEKATSKRGWSNSSNSILVTSNSEKTLEKLMQHRFGRIMYDEVDSMRNGGNGYQTLMDPDFSPGAVRWGWTGTITHKDYTDVKRPLAFVKHDKAWEAATEQAVEAEVLASPPGWYLIAPRVPLPAKLDFRIIAMPFLFPEEWCFLKKAQDMQEAHGCGNLYASSKQLTVGQKAVNAAIQGWECPAPTLDAKGKRSWSAAHLPSSSIAGSNLSSLSSTFGSWLKERMPPGSIYQAKHARECGERMAWEDARQLLTGDPLPFIPTLQHMVVSTINGKHPDAPVLVICQYKEEVSELVLDFNETFGANLGVSREAVGLIGSKDDSETADTGSVKHTCPKARYVFLGDFVQMVQDARNAGKPPPVLVSTRQCIQIGIDGLQDIVSVMYILSPHDNPSQDWQAVGRLLRTGQKSDTVTVRSFVMLHTPAEDSFVRQALKTRCFEFYHGYDIRSMLDLPILKGGEEVGQQADRAVSGGSHGAQGEPCAETDVSFDWDGDDMP